MSTRTVERVEDWESQPFSDGYRGLHGLADQEFSGIVERGSTKLCMLNGRVVGILNGTIEDFERADGVAYEAPSPALPMLVYMQEHSDEVRAKYYTEDTPLSEVDRTLSEGGFTGYVELSENVLSGDYYVVYHGGRSMSVAFVGESSRLETDGDAFDLADDEVGIYEVRPVDVDIVEIPEPEVEPSAGTESAAGDDPETDHPPDTSGEAAAADVDADSVTEAGDDTADPDAVPDTEAGPDADTETDTDDEAGADTPDEPSDGASTLDPLDVGEGVADEDETAGIDLTAEATNDDDLGGSATEDLESPTTDDGLDVAASDEPEDADSVDVGESDSDDADHPADATDDETDDATADTDSTDTAANEPAAEDTVVESESDAETGSEDEDDADAEDASPERDAPPEAPTETVAEEPARPDPLSGPQPVTDQSSDTTTSSPEPTGKQDSTADAGRLEVRSVPSVDPARTSLPKDDDPAEAFGATGTEAEARTTQPAQVSEPDSTASDGREPRTTARDEPSSGAVEKPSSSSAGTADSTASDAPDAGTQATERVADLQDRLDEREREIERLEAELEERTADHDSLLEERDELVAERDALAAERDELQTQLADLRAERDELRAEVEELESKLETLEQKLDVEASTVAAGDRNLSPADALAGTNLFVRYDSKSEPTLESAHGGTASQSEVSKNLKLNYHTTFEADEVTVDGKPFEEFLFDSLEYRFVDWVVNHLLYEIRDTNAVEAMQDLYDALPRIDRAELDGGVSVTYQEDGQDQHGEETFDVVLRDRMGDPLVVANLNDSRQAASDSMMSSLLTTSTRVCESKDTLASSVLVTRSFFQPEALETASDATGGGLLSRDKRKSFVKLARKQGYHLCLVEARNDEFYLTVPEL